MNLAVAAVATTKLLCTAHLKALTPAAFSKCMR